MNVGEKTVSLNDFRDDAPWEDGAGAFEEISVPDQIDGVQLYRLVTHADDRGDLTVLLSQHYAPFEIVPHVYQVTTAPGSVRAWVYHKRQHDRLAYTNGDIRVVLYDLRPGSPTHGKLNVLDVGSGNKVLLVIPPFVVHGVQNRGDSDAAFMNMPTRAYDPADPDKSRLPWDHPGIPYRFE